MAVQITFDKHSLFKNGVRWVPYVGEFHFSRVNEDEWDEELSKCKLGGLDVVSTYVFWNHHEFYEGKFNFEGNFNVRKFIELAKANGLYVILRIGPWVHGEGRYGGFPDWLIKKNIKYRTNDPEYLVYVERFWKKLYEQVKDIFDNVIGIQIENEYYFKGEGCGDDHINTLTKLAKKIGFNAPLYTCTGWANAFIGENLPCFSGYVDAPWARHLDDLRFNDNYMMKYDQNKFDVDNKYEIFHMNKIITFDRTKYPLLTCELGGGQQVTRHRRPIIHQNDIGAMTLVKIANGVNMFGFFMYKGGSNPIIDGHTLEENIETGYPNDYSVISYDFQSPIGEFGRLRDSYNEIKLYSYFMNDFGDIIANMDVYLDENGMLAPDDQKHLRTAVRRNGNSGFIFANNFIRNEKMPTFKNKSLLVKTDDQTIQFPKINISNGDYFFFPFNVKLLHTEIHTATLTPFMKLNSNCLVFYGNKENGIIDYNQPTEDKFLILSKEDALNAYRIIQNDCEYLVISNQPLVKKNGEYNVVARKNVRMKIYPSPDWISDEFTFVGKEDEFFVYEKEFQQKIVQVPFEHILYASDKTYKINVSNVEKINDYDLSIDYNGDYLSIYNSGDLIADEYYCNGNFVIPMKRFAANNDIYLKIKPSLKSDLVNFEKKPKYHHGVAYELTDVKLFEKHYFKLMK